jgi:coniferyl-aldehyde dehydrogenase
MTDDTAAIKQLKNALALQKKAFLKNQYPSAEERKANIGKIPVMVLSNRDAIKEALSKDFGNHPKATADMVEILGVAGRAAYVLSKIDDWMKYDSREFDTQMYGSSAKGEVRYQPKGVVGNIVRMCSTVFRYAALD